MIIVNLTYKYLYVWLIQLWSAGLAVQTHSASVSTRKVRVMFFMSLSSDSSADAVSGFCPLSLATALFMARAIL
jgi:hypothetical protein